MRLAASLLIIPLCAFAQEIDFDALTDLADRISSGQNPTAAELKPLEDARAAVVSSLGIKDAPEIDEDKLAEGIRLLRMSPYLDNGWAQDAGVPMLANGLELDVKETAEFMKLVFQAGKILTAVAAREEQHRLELAKRGVEELPASTEALRFKMDLGSLAKDISSVPMYFDEWGELFVDRRFVSQEELVVIEDLESSYRNVYEKSGYAKLDGAAKKIETRAEASRKWTVPVFRGFEGKHWQEHDALALKMATDFNGHKLEWTGGSTNQVKKVSDLSAAIIKSHMIEETGGGDSRSRAAWAKDPLQVNVPGDWDDSKTLLGLKKPSKRNEGDLETNVMAGIKFLSRKGFGASGKPAASRPKGFFDGWRDALRRYNGRRDKAADGHAYSECYSDKILRRAQNPDVFVPIEIPLKKK